MVTMPAVVEHAEISLLVRVVVSTVVRFDVSSEVLVVLTAVVDVAVAVEDKAPA